MKKLHYLVAVCATMILVNAADDSILIGYDRPVTRRITDDVILYTDGTITAKYDISSGTYSASINKHSPKYSNPTFFGWYRNTEPEKHFEDLSNIYASEHDIAEELEYIKELEEFE